MKVASDYRRVCGLLRRINGAAPSRHGILDGTRGSSDGALVDQQSFKTGLERHAVNIQMCSNHELLINEEAEMLVHPNYPLHTYCKAS
jgi:hypothetical protein